MKKLYFLVILMPVLMLVAMMTSCSNDIDKVKSLTKELENDSEDWDKEKWKQVMTDFYTASIHFFEGEPSKEEFEKFEEAFDDFGRAVEDAGTYRDVYKKFKNKDKELKELNEKFYEAYYKYKEKYDEEYAKMRKEEYEKNR